LAQKVSEVVKERELSTNPGRLARLQEVQKRVNDLRDRGLLRKQRFVSVSTSDFERRYSLNLAK